MPTHVDPEVRFAMAIAKLLMHFNRIDTNVGLCLSYLINESNPEATYDQLARMHSQKRFEMLKRLVATSTEQHVKRAAPDFHAWLETATWARNVRNRYVHGNWDHVPHRKTSPLRVYAPPFMRGRLGEIAEERMTLSDLEDVAMQVETVSNQLAKIRKKHGF